jgi:hypothetical protein
VKNEYAKLAELSKTLFPVGTYSLKIYGEQFKHVCETCALLEGLLKGGLSEESIDNFNSIISAASEGSGEGRIPMVTLAETLQKRPYDDVRRFATTDYVCDVGNSVVGELSNGLPFLAAIPPHILAGLSIRAVATVLGHYVINKDMMESNPEFHGLPTHFVRWRLNYKIASVEIISNGGNMKPTDEPSASGDTEG